MAKSPDWASVLVRNENGALPTLTNVVRVLQKDPLWSADRLYYDEFLDRIIIANSPSRQWTDEDDYRLTVYIQEMAGMVRVADHLVAKGVRLVAKQRVRHCVREHLASLTWDGVPRVATAFATYWGATRQAHAYVQAASTNFFIGIIARVMDPGCKLDTMPVFEGKQGIKKSTALEIIGSPWYAVVNEIVTSKDFLQCLRGKLILEIAELQAFSRSDIAHVKSMMSTRSDNYRPSYGRTTMEFPRRCVFAGTCNLDDWGTDDTGLRRFWPITCGVMDCDGLRGVKDQLFAEALAMYRFGTGWWVMPDQALHEQAERQQHDDWTDAITTWAELELSKGEKSITVPDLAAGALKLPLAQLDKSSQMRIARVLRLNGWVRKTSWIDGKSRKAWEPQGGKVEQGNDDFIT